MKKILVLILLFIPLKGWSQTLCNASEFQITHPNDICPGKLATFSVLGPAEVSFTVTWQFEDGTVLTGNPVTRSYSTEGIFSTTIIITRSNGVVCMASRGAFVSDPYISGVENCIGRTSRIYVNWYGEISGTINFGDGTSQNFTGEGAIEHVYSSAGNFTISANVTTAGPTSSQPFDVPCTRTVTQTIKIPSCAGFECENRDFENGDFARWYLETNLRPCDVSDCSVEGPRLNEHQIVSGNGVDSYGGFPVLASGGTYSMKLGNNLSTDENSYSAEYYSHLVTPENAIMAYRVAAVVEHVELSNVSNPTTYDLPYISLALIQGEGGPRCTDFYIDKTVTLDWHKVNGQNIYYIPWTTYYFDLSDHIGETFLLQVQVRKGSYIGTDGVERNLFAYAYFDSYCSPPAIQTSTSKCIGSPTQFSFNTDNPLPNETVRWNMGDGTIIENGKNISHTYINPGTYNVTVDFTQGFSSYYGPIDEDCETISFTQTVSVSECAPPFVCETCIPAFSPLPGEKYLLVAWVKEGDGIGAHTYEHPSIRVNFEQGSISEHMRPSGQIIDGWQRIEGQFIVPLDAEKVSIELHNDGNTKEVFFDDIRIQPYNSSMRSFVYDPVTLRLVAELDERNYCTYYEYDEEGSLIRVKKETERGVKTIRESREGVRKR